MSVTCSRAIHRLLFAALAVSFLVLALPLRAAPIGGTLAGKVVMKTAGVTLPTAPLTVMALFVNPGLFRSIDEATDFRTMMTAPDGSFSFSGLDTSVAGVYRVLVDYKGVRYEPPEQDVTDTSGTTGKSRAVRFTNSATTAMVDIPVYEPVVSSAPANVTIKSDQIIMNEVRPQFYSVLEALQITNPGDRTLVGALNADGSMAQGVPLVFSAPANAQTITTKLTDLLPTADLTGQKLTLRTPIQPGASDLSATYDLPGSTSGLTFQRTLDYAATKVQVVISDSRQPIMSATLHNDGPIQAPQGATPFKQFSLDNAQAGKQIDLTIGPSPAAPPRTSAPTAQKSAFDRIREKATVPFLLVLAGVCLLLMLLILRAPQRSPNGASGTRHTSSESLSEPDSAPPADAPSLPNGETTSTEDGRQQQSRHARGRPHDYDLDDAEREIEAANSDTGEARNSRGRS